MKTELCRPSELGSVEIEAWRALQLTDPRFDNPFLSPTFARAVGDLDPRARVAVVSDGPTVSAFLPFSVTQRSVGLGIASGVASCHGLVQRPGFDYPLVEILNDCGLAVLEMKHFVSPNPSPASPDAKTVPTHVIDISAGYDAYLADRKASEPKYFNWLRRKLRRAELDLGPIEFTAGEPDREALNTVIQWKSNQYRRSGWPDPFAKRWVRDLAYVLAETDEPDLVGRVSALRVSGDLLAVDFSIHSQSVYGGWFVSYNPDYSRFSPGAIRWLFVIEDAASIGLQQLDIGPGDERYKVKLASSQLPLVDGHATRSCLRAVVHNASRVPRRAATDFILTHPRVRQSVRTTLRTAGRLRHPPAPVEVSS
jgi:CelD/BcsL family acetyltransferase involved in cellulose biosynthesis